MSLALAVPAGAARILCLGSACRAQAGGDPPTTFCDVAPQLRGLISAGYRNGRSPDLLALTAADQLVSGSTSHPVAAAGSWPSNGAADTSVPVVFAGGAVARGSALDATVTLDDVAPTIADAIGLRRPHPSVRSGTKILGVSFTTPPRLVVEIAMRGFGTSQLRDADPAEWLTLRALMRSGASTLRARTGSLPLDPSATLTTLGTGGLPWQHGITGTLIRNDTGQVTRAWSKGAPGSVIASLADDLDHDTDQRALVGLVARYSTDRGLIGDGWYQTHDTDRVVLGGSPAKGVDALLAAGFGDDVIPDLLAVSLTGSLPRIDRALGEILRTLRGLPDRRVLVVVTGTGSGSQMNATSAGALVTSVNNATDATSSLIAGASPGGVFLDRRTMKRAGLSATDALTQLSDLHMAGTEPVFEETFPGYAVSFARYCP